MGNDLSASKPRILMPCMHCIRAEIDLPQLLVHPSARISVVTKQAKAYQEGSAN